MVIFNTGMITVVDFSIVSKVRGGYKNDYIDMIIYRESMKTVQDVRYRSRVEIAAWHLTPLAVVACF